MKTTFKLILLFTFLLFSLSSYADHLMGGNFQWKQTGKDFFYVTFNAYRDCNGIPGAMNSITVKDSLGSNISSTVSTSSTGIDVTPVCKSTKTKCQSKTSTFAYGIQVYLCSFKLNLSKYKACKFTLENSSCCRSSTLTAGGSAESIYVYAILNKCYGTNNSPQIYAPGIMIVQQNQCINYNFGAFDIDSLNSGKPDSLVYALIKPLATSTSIITWNSPYTYDKPLKFDSFPKKNALWNPPSCAGFHFDPATGQLQFKATKIEQTVIAILTTEYRKDKYGKMNIVGQIEQDLNIICMSSPNHHVPTLSGINGGSSFDINIFAKRNNCFTINSFDADTADSLSLSWNNSLITHYNYSFTFTKGVKHPTATFCWNPDSAQINKTYQFVVYAKDNACPLLGITAQYYRVHVYAEIKDSISVTDLGCGNVLFRAFPKKGTSIKNFLWNGDAGLSSVKDSLVFHYDNGGRYHYSITAYAKIGGSVTDTGSIVIQPYIKTTLPSDTIVCDSTLLMIPSVTSGGSTPYKYTWNSGQTTASITAKITRDTTFIITASDNTCSNSDTMKIKLDHPFAYAGRDSILCLPANAFKLSKLGTAPSGGIWSGNGVSNDSFYPNNPKVIIGKNTLIYTTKDYYTCTASDTLNVTLLSKLTPKAGTYGPYCAKDTLEPLKMSSGVTSDWYNFDTSQSKKTIMFIAGNYYYNPYYAKAGVHKLLYKESYGGQCPSFDTTMIQVYALPVTPFIAKLGNDTLLASVIAKAYIWHRDSVLLSANTQMILAKQTGHYTVAVSDSNGCISDNSASVYVNNITGIISENAISEFHIYPNPATGILTIETPTIKEGQLSIINMLGQTEYQCIISTKKELDLHTLTKGIYLLKIQSKEGVIMNKIILK